jgi:hypothetical protein
MISQLRPLVAEVLAAQVKAHAVPSVCERFGLAPGREREAGDGKSRYVLTRLKALSDERVLKIAKQVVETYPDANLAQAIEALELDGHLITDVTRLHLAQALDARDTVALMAAHFDPARQLSGYGHAIRYDWPNSQSLERLGFMACSQAVLFAFLEDVLDPLRRDEAGQAAIAESLNPILARDGYALRPSGAKSGYPVYVVEELPSGGAPADALISDELVAFNEAGVHEAWRKALERRSADPEGAVTAAKSLLETVSKHILDAAGRTYGASDDLPKLYHAAAECLALAPSQQSEAVLKAVLGNCQAVVGGIAGMRNRLSDSHGQGRSHVKPSPRHAELAVNLAGSMAMFMIATWHERPSAWAEA